MGGRKLSNIDKAIAELEVRHSSLAAERRETSAKYEASMDGIATAIDVLRAQIRAKVRKAKAKVVDALDDVQATERP